MDVRPTPPAAEPPVGYTTARERELLQAARATLLVFSADAIERLERAVAAYAVGGPPL